jgi:hypothetical protein
VPTEQSTASATNPSRRTFLTRAVVGGAVVSSGVLAGTATGLLPSLPAGADDLSDADFAAFAIPLELAAVEICQAGLDSGVLADDAAATIRSVQGHHQKVVDTLTTLADADAPAPVSNTTFAKSYTTEIRGAAASEAVLLVLTRLEDTLTATHLAALASIPDPVTAKVVSQVLAAEAQQAAVLGRAGGLALGELTPDTVSTDGAVEPGDAGSSTSTTTTTSGN